MTATAQEILSRLQERPTLSRTVAAVRELDALAAGSPEQFVERRVLVVRNYTLEPVEPLLRLAAFQAGLRLQVTYSGYDPASEPVEAWREPRPDAVCLALGLAELAPALGAAFLDRAPATVRSLSDDVLAVVEGLLDRTRAAVGAPVIVHNFALAPAPAAGLADAQDPWGQDNLVRRLNLRLAELVAARPGVFLLDLDRALAQLGLDAAWDRRGGGAAAAPFTAAALRVVAEAQARHLRALSGPRVKAIVVDCDNTLWGGIIGEDGVEGIALGPTGPGRPHRDLQRQLLDLRRRGFVLAISSKNEPTDVLTVLRTHPDCLVGERDFATIRADWADKAGAVEAIAEELGLGLAQLAFLDDNPAECEWVRARLPEVAVLRWPQDLPGGTLEATGLFDSLIVTDEDRRRTELYRAESQRRGARAAVATIEEYLASLRMVATVGRATADQLPRVAQLIARTNQFNLTLRRHDLAAVDALASDPLARVLWLALNDRFGASGTIGCGILRAGGAVATIDTLLVSCRVIGRGVESVLLARLAREAVGLGARELIGEYVAGPRNALVADLYPRLGFRAAGEGRWTLAVDGEQPRIPGWIEVRDAEPA